MNKIKLLIPVVISLMFQAELYALPGTIEYLEGGVTVRDKSGAASDAVIGDKVDRGYVITTDKNGYAEVDKDGSLIKISSDTVFEILETGKNGKKLDVFSAVTGSVYLKIKKLTDKDDEPLISSPSIALGVRGTAFTVFAGLDGTSLVAVEEGIVSVEANGVSVDVNADEGIEVKPGNAPGAKFTVLRGHLDFKQWNDKNLDAFLADPPASAQRARTRLEYFVAKLRETKTEYDKNFAILTGLHDTLKTYTDAAQKQTYYETIVIPQEVLTGGLFINFRYYALSALSLKRFVLARMFVRIRSQYFGKTGDHVYDDFMKEYDSTVTLFEKEIVPFLVDADI